jgi:hypothetical protein
MATASFSDTEFLVAYCSRCAVEVLTHIDLGAAEDEIRRCVHCDGAITSELRPVQPDELEATGYAVVRARGCGNGGGCGAGGCGMREHP